MNKISIKETDGIVKIIKGSREAVIHTGEGETAMFMNDEEQLELPLEFEFLDLDKLNRLEILMLITALVYVGDAND